VQKGAERELDALLPLTAGRVSYQKGYNEHNLSVQLANLRPILRYFQLFPLKSLKRVALIKFLAIYKLYGKSATENCVLRAKEMMIVRRRVREINKINEQLKIKSALSSNR